MGKINLNIQTFIDRSRQIHGDKYDYSKVEYINNYSKVIIVCSKHGEYEQIPFNHLSGSGCLKCGAEVIVDKKTHTKEQFVAKAYEVHGDKYDYSKSVYINSKTKLEIICPIHGVFLKAPTKHLIGQGCQECVKINLSKLFCFTTDVFIEKANKIHDNKYSYNKANYVNNTVQVTITCPTHGDFNQTPANHLKGQGCPSCKNERIADLKTYSFEKFIKLSRTKHRDKYIYLIDGYKNTNSLITIICKEHGIFKQRARDHLKGRGCLKCGINSFKLKKSDTKEQFVAKAHEVHGDKYDYSKSVYINKYTNITISCSVHGDFNQTPGNHLFGKGCLKCGIDIRAQKRNLGLKKFIEKSNKVHKNKYNYNKVVYKNNCTRVVITCPVHGDFEQRPDVHMNGCSCPLCSGVIRYDNDSFISNCISVHGSKYNYSKVIYAAYTNKVIIVCPKHGDFEQTPGSHLSGSGCPKCKSSKGEKFIMRVLEKNNIPYKHQYRIPNAQQRYLYDFYLPDHNLLIEFHGIQHYKPIEFFGGTEGLRMNKERDLFKKDLAKLAGIAMIVFSYKELKKDKIKFEQKILNSIIRKQKK